MPNVRNILQMQQMRQWFYGGGDGGGGRHKPFCGGGLQHQCHIQNVENIVNVAVATSPFL